MTQAETAGRSGGCQCGAVRFRVAGPLGRACICHCRMCQKAFGSPFAALVSVERVEWTRGAPAHFASSDKARRGFCAACGTPLTYETADGLDLAIGAFDDPAGIPPAVQLGCESRLPWASTLDGLPGRPEEERAKEAAFKASLRKHQHPDHD